MGVYVGTSGELSNAYIGIPYPESISLDKNSINLNTIGQTEQLTATLTPTLSDKTITWASSDNTIATVSSSGLVTCVTPGECTITATTVNSLTATCTVKEGLPSTYQEVEYIESSGIQWIDTRVTPTTSTRFEIKYNIVSKLSEYDCILGATSDWQNRYYVGWRNSGGSYTNGVYIFSPTENFNSTNVLFGSVGVDYELSYMGTTLSDGTHNDTISSYTQAPSKNLYIFAENQLNSGAVSAVNAKLYLCKIYEGETLIRKFIPCYRIGDSEIGMYDMVYGVFYTNSGSGTFSKGADV